jgi:methanethiol S-methyltransferase
LIPNDALLQALGGAGLSRSLSLGYGVASYLAFLAAFLYAIGFVGNLVVTKTIDSPGTDPPPVAVLADTLLLGLFAVPHSVMARQGFKRWWTKRIPPAIERSTYVLTSSLLLGLLFWQWRPIPGVIWDLANPIARWLSHAIFWAGWALVFLSTFLIDHLELFGLRQVLFNFAGREYAPVGFKATLFYRWVRHPIMLGFLIAFWATPRMTAGHLLFAAATTAYILLALRIEERDLVSLYGEAYEAYKQQAGMLIPRIKR